MQFLFCILLGEGNPHVYLIYVEKKKNVAPEVKIPGCQPRLFTNSTPWVTPASFYVSSNMCVARALTLDVDLDSRAHSSSLPFTTSVTLNDPLPC